MNEDSGIVRKIKRISSRMIRRIKEMVTFSRNEPPGAASGPTAAGSDAARVYHEKYGRKTSSNGRSSSSGRSHSSSGISSSGTVLPPRSTLGLGMKGGGNVSSVQSQDDPMARASFSGRTSSSVGKVTGAERRLSALRVAGNDNSMPPIANVNVRSSSVSSTGISPRFFSYSAKREDADPPAAVASSSSSKKGGKLCCDKCDGPHETDDCPHYRKKREDHPDAQKNAWAKMGGTSTLPGAMLRSARVVRQPGDGSCLFHSMSYGLKDGSTASSLRTSICDFIRRNPTLKISDTPLSDWVKWDSGTSVTDYASKMSRGSWGGGIEMAALMNMKGVNVHVYEKASGGYKRISAFDHPDNPKGRTTVRVLYCGGVHYDAIVAADI